MTVRISRQMHEKSLFSCLNVKRDDSAGLDFLRRQSRKNGGLGINWMLFTRLSACRLSRQQNDSHSFITTVMSESVPHTFVCFVCFSFALGIWMLNTKHVWLLSLSCYV